MNRLLLLVAALFLLCGCDRLRPTPLPEFELRDFVITEAKIGELHPSNSFTGVGTLVGRNIRTDQVFMVLLEYQDKTLGPNSEPQRVWVLMKGGVGKVETFKGIYEEISARPDYSWSVLGSCELNPAKLSVVGSKGN